MTNKPLLLFQGPARSRSGYGDHTRDLILSLLAMDRFDILIAPTRWGGCPETGLDLSLDSHKLLFSKFMKNNTLKILYLINLKKTLIKKLVVYK